jgi:hypothetical protein
MHSNALCSARVCHLTWNHFCSGGGSSLLHSSCPRVQHNNQLVRIKIESMKLGTFLRISDLSGRFSVCGTCINSTGAIAWGALDRAA